MSLDPDIRVGLEVLSEFSAVSRREYFDPDSGWSFFKQGRILNRDLKKYAKAASDRKWGATPHAKGLRKTARAKYIAKLPLEERRARQRRYQASYYARAKKDPKKVARINARNRSYRHAAAP